MKVYSSFANVGTSCHYFNVTTPREDRDVGSFRVGLEECCSLCSVLWGGTLSEWRWKHTNVITEMSEEWRHFICASVNPRRLPCSCFLCYLCFSYNSLFCICDFELSLSMSRMLRQASPIWKRTVLFGVVLSSLLSPRSNSQSWIAAVLARLWRAKKPWESCQSAESNPVGQYIQTVCISSKLPVMDCMCNVLHRLMSLSTWSPTMVVLGLWEVFRRKWITGAAGIMGHSSAVVPAYIFCFLFTDLWATCEVGLHGLWQGLVLSPFPLPWNSEPK